MHRLEIVRRISRSWFALRFEAIANGQRSKNHMKETHFNTYGASCLLTNLQKQWENGFYFLNCNANELSESMDG